MIEIKDLKISFGEQVVLNGVNWFIAPKSRIGLVGNNGAGKTTLLRIIAGTELPDSGTVKLPGKRSEIGYLPQDLVEIDDIPLGQFLSRRAGMEEILLKTERAESELSSLGENSPLLKSKLAEYERLQREFDAKGGFDFAVESAKVLKGLGFRPETDAQRMTSEFSGGWKMRISLAALLLSRPDILLLDEPTNHLDTESMEWLESWLRDYRGTLIAISHDRRFLENTATSIAELSHGKIETYSMGYDKYLVEREERRARLEAERSQQMEKIENMQRFVERFRYKASKATQVQSRVKQLEKMEVTEVETDAKSVTFKFPESPRSGLNVIAAKNLEKTYGNHTVFKHADFTLQRGERVSLVGVNGAGKSTLLRLLNLSEAPTDGTVELGLNVKKKYYSQESSQNLDYSKTIWEEVCSTGSKLLGAEKRKLLGAFLFSGDEIYKPINVLSGGEKSRIGLLKMLLSESNLLILDEPTNHLDITTKELFQKALLSYGGTILIVSHDRSFLDDLVTRVVEIRDGKLYNYDGNYSYFINKRSQEAAAEAAKNSGKGKETSKKNVPAEQPAGKNDKNDNNGKTGKTDKTDKTDKNISAKERRRLDAQERNRISAATKGLRRELEKTERAISEDEARKEEISALLCDPSVLNDSSRVSSLMIELKEKEKRLSENYAKWEALSLEIEKASETA